MYLKHVRAVILLIAKQSIKYIDLGVIKQHLDREISDQSIEEIYRFGSVMLAEVSQRTAQINQKLYSLIGWSAASIAFLLFDKVPAGAPVWIRCAALTAIFLAACSVLLGSLGIKSGVGKIPSDPDWFCSKFYLDSIGMKRYHLLLMFLFHQQENLSAEAKAEFLARAECLFVPSLLLLTVVVFFEKLFL